MSLSRSHWYPGSDVVLDCIEFSSLHPYLLFKYAFIRWLNTVNIVQYFCILIQFIEFIYGHNLKKIGVMDVIKPL